MAIDRTRTSSAGPARPKGLSNAIQAVKKGTARLVADTLQLSTGEKLKEGNQRAVKQAVQTLENTVTHPFQTLADTAKGIVQTIVHPEQALKQVQTRFEGDPVDGLIASTNLGAAWAGLGAIALTAGALLAAPFTGGASLGLLPVAGTIGSVAGAAGLGTMGASFLKNQHDIATATTKEELSKESQELAGDYANAGLTALSAGVGKVAHKTWQEVKPKNLNPASAQRNAVRVEAKIREKTGIPEARSNGGTIVDDLSLEGFRKQALGEVSDALEQSAQGKRSLEVTDLDRGSFEGIDDLGERRIAFHGTREEVKGLIRENGFKNSSIGDYGSGIYLGSSADVGVNYADDVVLGRADAASRPLVYTAEIAPGKVMDYFVEKDDFLAWAKERFDPTDLSDPVNQLYVKPEVPVSPWIDNTWTRYLPRYAKEKGFDSILVRDIDGPGRDYWVLHDPKRVIVRQEIAFDAPQNRELFPSSIPVVATADALDEATENDKERR